MQHLKHRCRESQNKAVTQEDTLLIRSRRLNFNVFLSTLIRGKKAPLEVRLTGVSYLAQARWELPTLRQVWIFKQSRARWGPHSHTLHLPRTTGSVCQLLLNRQKDSQQNTLQWSHKHTIIHLVTLYSNVVFIRWHNIYLRFLEQLSLCIDIYTGLKVSNYFLHKLLVFMATDACGNESL